jgi:hypothetical protein
MQLLEALASGGYVEKAVQLATTIVRDRNVDGSDERNSELSTIAMIFAEAGYFKRTNEFQRQIGGFYYRHQTVIKLLLEAIKRHDLSHGLELAQSLPGWLEEEHRLKTLPRLLHLLAEEQRFDDIRNIISSSKTEIERNTLQTQLAIGLARAGRFAESFEAMETTNIESSIAFLAKSLDGFDTREKGLGLKALVEAITVVSWIRSHWRGIFQLIKSRQG